MIIARSVWGAAPASLSRTPMRLPATQVFIHHTTTPATGNLTADVRTVEAVGMERFGIFSYSYVVHPHDGEIFEGAGLMRGAHTAQRNSSSFGIAWIGDYTDRSPKAQQIDATRWLIDHLTRAGHLVPGADILGHRDVVRTACPGNKLYAVLDVIRYPWEGTMPDEVPKASAPVVALEPTPTGKGYWIITADGAVFAFGDAQYYGRVAAPPQ